MDRKRRRLRPLSFFVKFTFNIMKQLCFPIFWKKGIDMEDIEKILEEVSETEEVSEIEKEGDDDVRMHTNIFGDNYVLTK